ncbi:MAG: hypothetical protein O2783_02210 [Chloroflexi bacterium]|nr:hypothetical protein [Chloroflexota bacterium]
MVLSTAPQSANPLARSTATNDPITIRLHGRWDDVKAVVNHWHIEVEWRQAVKLVRDECGVDGMLSVRG